MKTETNLKTLYKAKLLDLLSQMNDLTKEINSTSFILSNLKGKYNKLKVKYNSLDRKLFKETKAQAPQTIAKELFKILDTPEKIKAFLMELKKRDK